MKNKVDSVIISRNGLSLFVNRYNDESNANLHRRAWFIIKQKNNTTDDSNKAIMMSKLWHNISNYGCDYPSEWTNNINRLTKNYFV